MNKIDNDILELALRKLVKPVHRNSEPDPQLINRVLTEIADLDYVSTTHWQTNLRIGFARAKCLTNFLLDLGLVGENDNTHKARPVLNKPSDSFISKATQQAQQIENELTGRQNGQVKTANSVTTTKRRRIKPTSLTQRIAKLRTLREALGAGETAGLLMQVEFDLQTLQAMQEKG